MQRAEIPELLCPAGDETALRAAVDCGADAVYLGYKAFGARASAVNFDDETLERAVHYAHLYHVRIHVAVNTLTKQTELSTLHEALTAIECAGADAVIVQDLGVAAIVKRDFPMLSLHASTQMALCNASGAHFAKERGFDRVVLARECTLADIAAVARTGIETEIFAHGALCSSVSGRCLISSMAGGRSGNRGRCAQPCRQSFTLEGTSGALLSLKDLCLIDDLPALCAAGISSLKIEGRLKSAEYVAVVTETYRRALDAVSQGTFRPDSKTREALMQVFHRGGFTRGHAMGVEDAALCATERVSHDGLPLGVVIGVRNGLASMRVDRALNDGDSLQIRDVQDIDLRYAGHDVEEGNIATLRLRPDVSVRIGSAVSRLADARQLEHARAHEATKIPIQMHAIFEANKPMRLSTSDGISEACVTGDVVERAQKRAGTMDEVRKQLCKLGDTPFVLANNDVLANGIARLSSAALTIKMDDDLFLPVSALNALRRDGIDALLNKRIRTFRDCKPHSRMQRSVDTSCEELRDSPITPSTLAVIFSDATIALKLQACGATMLIYEPLIFTPAVLASVLPSLPKGTWLRLPPQLTEQTLQGVLSIILQHEQHLGGLMLESVGQLNLASRLPIFAGEGIPITNRECITALAKTRACGFTLWAEWTKQDQQALLPMALPCLLKVYGRETLMLLNHCPERVARGLSTGHAACNFCKDKHDACARENAMLVDRKGFRFPLSRTVFPEGCILSVLNALPTELSQNDVDRRTLCAGMLLRFTIELPQQQLEITSNFAAILRGQTLFMIKAEQTTTGHWQRGVE